MSAAEQYREFLARGGVADLSDRVQLAVVGDDRVRYLNGQVTSDVRKLAPGAAQPACVTTAKGKLCAEVMITATAEALVVDADGAVRESLPARLERYIVADDVAIAETSSGKRLLHFLGTDPRTLPAFADAPIVRARRFGMDGWDLRADAVPPEVTARLPLLDEELLEAIRIENGVPRWGRELDEDTLPPEAGLDRTHIDYAKGCYIGQEVISRLRSVGHVNRRLAGFVSADGAPLAAGMRIFAAGDDARPAGEITSAAWSFFMEKPVALGYLRRASALAGLLARGPGGAAAVTAHELPLVSR